jgi:hypothetical protein
MCKKFHGLFVFVIMLGFDANQAAALVTAIWYTLQADVVLCCSCGRVALVLCCSRFWHGKRTTELAQKRPGFQFDTSTSSGMVGGTSRPELVLTPSQRRCIHQSRTGLSELLFD